MSNALAIAHATEALRGMLDRIAQADLPFAVSVEARRPPSQPPTDPTITVFCFQATPNVPLRNHDTPTRDGTGRLLQRPSAAVDLHLLLSCYGQETELVPQVLLGLVVRTLHEQPLLSLDDLRTAAAKSFLNGTDLAAAPQRVRLTPSQMDLDDLSKLWSMFSDTPYAPSVVYEANLVTLESSSTPRSGPPVQQHRVRVVPGLPPLIERMRSRPEGSDDEPQAGGVPAGHEVLVDGRHFTGDRMSVRVGRLPVPAARTRENQLVFVPPAELPAGVHPVRVLAEIDFNGDVRVLDSAPVAMGRQATIVDTERDGGTITVRLDVEVRAEQRASLLLDELDSPVEPPRSYRIPAAFPLPAVRDPDAVPFTAAGVAAGRYLVRVEIDGVPSPVSADLREPDVDL